MTYDSERSAKANLRDTKENLREAGDAAKRAGRDTLHAVNDGLSDAKHSLQETAHDVGERVRRFLAVPADELSEVTENVKARIERNPVESSVAALAIGIVLGMLIRR